MRIMPPQPEKFLWQRTHVRANCHTAQAGVRILNTMLHTRTCSSHPTLLTTEEAHALLEDLSGWALSTTGGSIIRTFNLADYYQTLALVNAIAYIAHQQNHHPELLVSYNKVVVTYNTHDVGGLSINDFICAARINTLIS